jgi:putative DNA methylase
VQEEPWTLDAALIARVRCEPSGMEVLPVDAVVFRALQKEDERRASNRELIIRMIEKDSTLAADPVLVCWSDESRPLPQPWPTEGELLPVRRVMGDPAWSNMNFH